MATCQIHKKYAGIRCQNPALESDQDAYCLLHSRDQKKDPAAFKAAVEEKMAREDYNFRGVFFPGLFSFEGQEFNKDTNFSRATFSGLASFFGATFSGYADFSGAIFSEDADFSGSIFSQRAGFLVATFSEYADFAGATFLGLAVFSDATFSGLSSFFGATFSAEAFFNRTIFSQGAHFPKATFSGKVIFRNLNKPGPGEPPTANFQGQFTDLELVKEAVLRFQDLSLAQVEFAGTDLRHVDFRHVAWHPYRGRQAIYDEIPLRAKEKERPGTGFSGPDIAPYLAAAPPPPPHTLADKYGEVERLYRNLKINYEKEGDYKNAGDFHYGEMEMHRRASKWRWFPLYWYNLYRFLSGYGERPSWALGWLALFLFSLAGLVWWRGLEIANPQQWAGFGDSSIYILQKATLQRPEWAKPATFGGQLLSTLSVLLIPGQAALFLLALRNRLGRRR
jgi:uncharacterized protein YjbI with pentapeptide repeats